MPEAIPMGPAPTIKTWKVFTPDSTFRRCPRVVPGSARKRELYAVGSKEASWWRAARFSFFLLERPKRLYTHCRYRRTGEKTMVTKIQKWGNSLGIRIPKSFAKEAQVGAGSRVDLAVKAGRLIIIPVRPQGYDLET